jgi:hypothetical protein
MLQGTALSKETLRAPDFVYAGGASFPEGIHVSKCRRISAIFPSRLAYRSHLPSGSSSFGAASLRSNVRPILTTAHQDG